MGDVGTSNDLSRNRAVKRTFLQTLAVLALILVGFHLPLFITSPPNSYSPLCTYDLTYQVQATIAVDGQQYSDEATFQRLTSRRWIREMNSAGCPPTRGTVLAFRLSDNRAVLVETRLCEQATRQFADEQAQKYGYEPDYSKAMRQRPEIDLASFCVGLGGNLDLKSVMKTWDGYLFDNADNPTRWEGVRFRQPTEATQTVVTLIAAKATAMDAAPADNLERVAPGLLRADFDYQRNWWDSPERVVPHPRRNPQVTVKRAEPFAAPFAH